MNKTVLVELFFDYSSPWTYLAFSQVRKLMDRTGAKFSFRPILVGGVFNTVNPSVYEMRSAPVLPKVRYMNTDLKEWSEAYELKILDPYASEAAQRVSPFPVNSVKSLRGKMNGEKMRHNKKLGAEFAKNHGVFMEYSDLVFKKYWADSEDISKDEVLEEIVEELGRTLSINTVYMKVVY